MIPKINARGHSFKGVTAYLMNDKIDPFDPNSRQSNERVAWSETFNLGGLDVELAARVMAKTDLHRDELKENSTGVKSSAGAVYHFSIAWAQDETPDRDHMRETGLSAIEHLGLSDHQFYMVNHSDTKHPHLHFVVNLTHPETGKRANLGLDKRKLSAWSLAYEKENGMKCQAREDHAENALKSGNRKKDRQEKRSYAAAITRAFEQSDNGLSFIQALKSEGLELGRSQRGKGFVIVDDRGSVQALTRNLEISQKGRAKTAAISAKLADVTPDQIRDGDAIAKEIKDQNKAEWVAEQKAERRQSDVAAELAAVETRQEAARAILEAQLAETIGERLKSVREDAERLKSAVEGRGVLLSLRRMWQGKKDRQNLAGMKDEISRAENAMSAARADLAAIHDKERAELKQIHEKENPRFADQTIERQIETLEYIAKADAPKYNPENKDKPIYTRHARNEHVSLEQAHKERKSRIARRIYQMREEQRQAEQEATREAQKMGLRPRYEERQAEIDAQEGKPEKSRIERQAEASRLRRDKGKGFDRE